MSTQTTTGRISTASSSLRKPLSPYEPDEAWKAELKAQIAQELDHMVQAAKDNLEAELHKQGPQSRDRLTNEYQKSFREIQSFAHEEFVNRLGMEREQRRWAGGQALHPGWQEVLQVEQQGILKSVQSDGANPHSASPTQSGEGMAGTASSASPISAVPTPPPARAPTGPTETSSSSSPYSSRYTTQSVDPPKRTIPPVQEVHTDSSDAHTDSTDDDDYSGSDSDSIGDGEELLRHPGAAPVAAEKIAPQPPQRHGSISRPEYSSMGAQSSHSPSVRRTPSRQSIPEVWRPSISQEEDAKNSTPYAMARRGSTASIRSTGSTNRRPPATADPISESPGDTGDVLSSNAERERRMAAEAEKQWSYKTRNNEKESHGHDRAGDRRSAGSEQVPHRSTESGNIPSPVSAGPATSPPPPPVPLETKPRARQPSISQEDSDYRYPNRGAGASLLSATRPAAADVYRNPSSISRQGTLNHEGHVRNPITPPLNTSFPSESPSRNEYFDGRIPGRGSMDDYGHHYPNQTSPTPLRQGSGTYYPPTSSIPVSLPRTVDRDTNHSPQYSRASVSHSPDSWRAWNHPPMVSQRSNLDLRQAAARPRNDAPDDFDEASDEEYTEDDGYEAELLDRQRAEAARIAALEAQARIKEEELLDRQRAEAARIAVLEAREARLKEEEFKRKAEEASRKAKEAEEREQEASRKEKEAREREVEAKKKEREARRKELEATKKEVEARKKEEEARRREEEARLKEAETQRKEKEIKDREDALRRREAEVAVREAEANRKEEERIRKEEEAREEARRKEERGRRKADAEAKRTEAKRREMSQLRREAEEAEERAEAEEIRRENEETRIRVEKEKKRREEEARIRAEERAKEDEQRRRKEEAEQRLRSEEDARRANEASWNKLNNSRMEAEAKKDAKFKEEQARRRAEEELRQKEAEAKRVQEEFQKREQEIRRRTEERKRGDSFGAESWSSSTYSSTSSNSSAGSRSTNSQRSGTSTSTSPPPSVHSTSAPSRTTTPSGTSVPTWTSWGAAQTPTPTSQTPNRSSGPSTTPTPNPNPKPRTGSTGAYNTPPLASQPSPVESEWQRRQDEHAREQQEKFRLEQERIERERQARSGRLLSKEDVARLFDHHEKLWSSLPSTNQLKWDMFPWPMIKRPSGPDDITLIAISGYVLSPYYPDKDPNRPTKDRIKEHIRRWHPDRFDTKLLPKVIEADKERVREGAGSVVRSLNDLLMKENSPSPFS